MVHLIKETWTQPSCGEYTNLNPERNLVLPDMVVIGRIHLPVISVIILFSALVRKCYLLLFAKTIGKQFCR